MIFNMQVYLLWDIIFFHEFIPDCGIVWFTIHLLKGNWYMGTVDWINNNVFEFSY